MTYQHLDTNIQSQIEKGTQVYHVTKEFGPASFTELGRTVTALAAAQQKSNLTEVAIVMPFYTFLRRLAPEKAIDMMVEVRNKQTNQMQQIEFHVFKMIHAFNPPVQPPNKYEYQMIDGVNTSVMITPQRPVPPTDGVPVYMIGQGNRRPFTQAFKCRFPHEIYDENVLPNEWKDQYFAKAAAAFLAHKATAADEESIFAPIRIVPRVDIVHIHGASNAYVAKHLQDKRDADDLGPRPPAIVYTMHDHDDELLYSNTFRNVRKFLDSLAEREELRKYVYDHRMFMAKLAIDRAQAVTYASRAVAADIIEGRRELHLKELIMDSLLKKVQGARFYGISNAIDFHSSDHPFMTDKLVRRNMAFPQYALAMIQDQPSLLSKQDDDALLGYIEPPQDTPTSWILSEGVHDFVFSFKDRVKRFLVKQEIFIKQDTKRPIVIYRAANMNKEVLQMLPQAVEYFVKNNMRFIILGKPADYLDANFGDLQKRNPDHVLLLTSARDQRRFAIFARASADFVFSPNPDGHEIMQDMAFGAAVITTKTGPLKNSFIDRSDTRNVEITYVNPDVHSERGALITSYEYYNSYIFNSTQTLGSAIHDAAKEFQLLRKNKALREEFVLRMIRSAFTLGYDRGHYQGPVHEYHQVYEMALQDRFIPEARRHEVEQEMNLVSRLQDTEIQDWE
jgi:glycogen synthase